ncbi:MAG: hypothetical protein HY052_01155 [Proteobacteria bacterium]|nr:hypothetical protein [Pseudomonadota bacterium]
MSKPASKKKRLLLEPVIFLEPAKRRPGKPSAARSAHAKLERVDYQELIDAICEFFLATDKAPPSRRPMKRPPRR